MVNKEKLPEGYVEVDGYLVRKEKKFTILYIRHFQAVVLFSILFMAALLFIGAAVTSDPYDGTGWNTSAPNNEAILGNSYQELQDLRKGVELRANREHLTYASSSVGGWHSNGSAVCYIGTTAEPNLPDDSAALSDISRDNGRLWIDTSFEHNLLKRWDASAWEPIATIAGGTTSQAFMHNTDPCDGDGWRASQIRAFGEQSGGEKSTLGYIEFSHDGASDDEKGKVRILLNDGDDANAPSLVPLSIGSDQLVELPGALSVTGDFAVNTDKFTVAAATGNTVVAGTFTSTGVATLADSSQMASSAAPTTDADLANKKYVDDQWDPNTYAGGETTTIGNGFITKMGRAQSTQDTEQTFTFGTAFPTACITVVISREYADMQGPMGLSEAPTKTSFKIDRYDDQDNSYFGWIAIGY